MIKFRFYCWWKHRVGNLKVLPYLDLAWDVTALYIYFGVIGFEFAIKIYKYRIARKFRRITNNENFEIFT